MDRTTAMFKRKNKETLDTSQEKKLSPFPRYVVTVVLCTLICCVGFVFLMFKTNTIFSVDNVELTTGYKNPRVTVTSTTSAIEQDEVEVPGVSVVAGGFYDYDENIYTKLASSGIGGMNDARAKSIAALYLHGVDLYGANAIAGIGGNICFEGWPGLCQYYNTHDEWEGPGTASVVSTPSNPVYVRNAANINVLETASRFGGVGICQFTYKVWRQEIAQQYKKYLPTSGTLTDDDLRAAEIEYVINTVIPRYAGISQCTSASAAADYWLVNYEQNGNTHEDQRCTAAEQIYAIFNGS